ncbi:hypothetical protein FB45DRAFT_839060 [Roridomyces roridus]|uniref:NmrA-like domain-containing protein n=1 Tax=Roridomyces roridus TaxID=1738132 RepID=A0AAD7BHE6_9AGAR|nr:hypothetical protein FB45DRAFT_839060 [Roridomyces roridus]
MSSYKSFALFGAGTIGVPILNALVANKASVVLFTRPDSAPKANLPSSVKIVKVDFSDAGAVAAALKEHQVDVVLSTLTTTAAGAQQSLVEAAKRANVKLFVPSEYGMPTEGHSQGPLGDKNRTAESLKAAGIPYVRFFTGNFIEFAPWLTSFDAEKKKFTITGTGNVPGSFTSIGDIAAFVAHVLTTLPPSELENRIFRLEGERATLNEVAKQFGATVDYVDAVPGDDGHIKTWLLGELESGGASAGWNAAKKAEGTGVDAAGSGNEAWPGKFKSIKEVHGL